MKEIITACCLWVVFALPLEAQIGFNQSYDFSLFANQFNTILVDNDTIVFVGISSGIDSPYIQSALVGRVDSLGQIVGFSTFTDSLGGYLAAGENLIKTPDDGYAFHTAIIFRQTNALYKFGKDLSLQSIYEFTDTVNLAVFYEGIIALEDGYLLAGIVQRPNHKYDSFVRKINAQGTTLWFKYYGIPAQGERVLGMSQLTDTTFALYGSEGTSTTNPDELHSKIWIIDSSGIVLKTWSSPDSLKWMGILELHPDASGNLFAFTRTFLGYNDWDDYMLQPTLVKFDTNLDVEWSMRFGPTHSSFSYWTDLRPTPDGNFIGVGKVAPYDLADLNAHLYGWMYKFTPEGDSIWARADLSTIPYQSGIDDNVFGGVGFLSSGSVVAGGNSYINGQIYGWIVKVTPDGCIDTLLCQSSAARPEPEPPQKRLRLSPNPADSEVSIDCTGLPEETVLTLTAVADGRVVWQQTADSIPSLQVATDSFPQGIYVLTAHTPRGATMWEKLLIFHR